MAAVTEKLTVAERDLLEHAEEKIQRGLDTFREVGEALMTVRDNRLYREKFETFEDYCRDRWGFTGKRAYQLATAATLAELISGGSTEDGAAQALASANESQLRPLAQLLPPFDATPEEQSAAEQHVRDAWVAAVRTAPQDAAGKPKVTAAHVAKTLAGRTPVQEAKGAEPESEPRDLFDRGPGDGTLGTTPPHSKAISASRCVSASVNREEYRRIDQARRSLRGDWSMADFVRKAVFEYVRKVETDRRAAE